MAGTKTNYYHVETLNNRPFLISPLGNPLFYLGVTSVDAYSTPLTPAEKRLPFFDSLPPTFPPFDHSVFAAATFFRTAYGDSNSTFSFIVANELRKYCVTDETMCTLPVPAPPHAACPASPCNLTALSSDLETVRLASWAFSGEGKFFGQETLDQNAALPHPSFPVLQHDPSKLPSDWPSVKNLVAHPDPWDSETATQLDAALTKQISKHTTDPNVVGWSMGNEKNEIIASSEIEAILQMGATVPAKQVLVLHALNDIYGGKLQKLNHAWGTSFTQNDLVDSVPVPSMIEVAAGQPSTLDLENLREFYEDAYYSLLRNRVQVADGFHHLYFGSWILSGDNGLDNDWPIAAKYSDVVGFDDFSPGPLDPHLAQLIENTFQTTGKPALLGAWGVPTDYGGSRGFGWNSYTPAMTLSDLDSGHVYADKIKSLAANPYLVGAMVFDYYDEPLTGRGGDLTPGDLVAGENFAFGLLDSTDTPKYDFVNQVRAGNCAALAALGLTTCPQSSNR